MDAVGDGVDRGDRGLALALLVHDRLDLAAPAVAPVVGLGWVRVDGDVEILGGPGLEHDQLADPVVILADQLDARHAVVVRDLLALPALRDRDARDQLEVLVPEPDERLRNFVGLVGVAAIVELLLDLAELSRRESGHEIALS